MVKYILLENADGNDPRQLRIFNTVDARARATREAILGPSDDENKDMPCPELLELATEGIVRFEGEPSIEWIDAEVPEFEELEELLRSAHCIAGRKGEGTAWERFAESIRQAGIGSVTARTYRVLESDVS